MSGGSVCTCPERTKPIALRAWVVVSRRCNHSAFNGSRYTPSQWSAIVCEKCRAYWRTKALYVGHLLDAPKEGSQ